MAYEQVTQLTSLILRFYAKCFSFPYEEMNYELQHLFRVIERHEIGEEEVIHVDQVLTVINFYQGEEIKDLRIDYAELFSSNQERKALCPMVASEFLATFAKHYDPEKIIEELWESGIPINPDEALDSIINYLEYSSLLCEQYIDTQENEYEIKSFFKEHILIWIPKFCDVLYKAANVEFYREVAFGLKSYLLALE
jgi:TorA maturation chaperone TorD